MSENYKDILSNLSTSVDQETLLLYLQGKLSEEKKHEIEKQLLQNEFDEEAMDGLQEFKDKIIPLIAVMKIINLYVKRFDVQYLKVQKFLNPYPSKLALRSDLKSFK